MGGEAYAPANPAQAAKTPSSAAKPRSDGFLSEKKGLAGSRIIEIEGKARGLPDAKIKEIKANYSEFVNACYRALVQDDKYVRLQEDIRRLGLPSNYSGADIIGIWNEASSCLWSNCTYSETQFLSEAFDKGRKTELTFNIPSRPGKFGYNGSEMFEMSPADMETLASGRHVRKMGAGVSYDVFIKGGEMKVVGTGRFIDCDTSAYAIADVLAKLGVESNIVYLPGHAILNFQGAQGIYIETTSDTRAMEVLSTILNGSYSVKEKYGTAGVLLPFSSEIARLASGNAYSSKGEYGLAIEEFGKFIEAYPNVWEAYDSRGGAYSSLGKYDLALLDYGKADKLDPGNIGVKASFAYFYLKQNKHSLAIEYFNAAIKLADAGKSNSAGFTSALFENRGKSYSKLGKYNDAIGDFTKALAADKNNILAFTIYESRADAYSALKKYDLAAADYEKAAKEKYSSRSNDEYIQCAEMYMAAGRPAKAAIYYLRVLDNDNYNYKAQMGCGNALFRMKRYDLAAKHFDEVKYEGVEAALMAGKSFYLQKSHGKAITAYMAVTTDYDYSGGGSTYKNISAAQYAAACIGCGLAMMGEKNLEGARDYFSKSIKAAPGGTEAYFGRGQAQLQLKQYGEATGDFSAAIARDPKYSDAYFQRAEAYAAMGKFVHASVNYKMAADIYNERHEDGKAQEALQKAKECGSKPNRK